MMRRTSQDRPPPRTCTTITTKPTTTSTIPATIANTNTTTKSNNNNFIMDASTIPLIAGFMGGVVSTTLLLPLDIVKVRLQVTESTSTTTNTKKHHWRSFRIVGGIIKYEGIRGLYQGWVPSVLGSSISWGGYFYCYELLKYHLVQYKINNKMNNNNNNNTTISSNNNIHNNNNNNNNNHYTRENLYTM
jgi:hypothetical protein